MEKYKRLTKYNEYNHDAEVYAYTVGKEDIYFDGVDIVGNENSRLAQETINRLAELEDKIENGTLIELPCKVGDTVFFVYETDNDEMFIDKGLIESFSYDEAGVWFRVIYENLSSYWHTALSIGDTVFLTEAEAEQRLKELKDER